MDNIVLVGSSGAQAAAKIAGLCPGLAFVSAVHPAASLGRETTIGPGTDRHGRSRGEPVLPDRFIGLASYPSVLHTLGFWGAEKETSHFSTFKSRTRRPVSVIRLRARVI